LSLGPCKGGVIRLADPIDGKPLLIGEGIETVLTVMEATTLPGWATLGTSGLVHLELPDNVTEVVLLAENDGGPNEKALREIASVLVARAVKCRIARPPPGSKDFNDLVNGKSGHSPEAGRIVVREAIEAATNVEVEAESEAENKPENEDSQFQLTEAGLSWRKDERGNWKWIAQPFEILGWARDAADASGQSGDWAKLILRWNRNRTRGHPRFAA
jgi:Toprim domain